MPWKIEILDANGEKETILDYSFAEFTERINGIGDFRIVITASSSYNFNKYVEYNLSNAGSKEQGLVYFTNPSSFLEFKGWVEQVDYDSSGNLVLTGSSTVGFAKNVILDQSNRAAEANTARATYILGVVDGYYKLAEGTITAFSGNNLAAVYYQHNNAYQALSQMVVQECNQDFFMTYDATVGNNDLFEVRDDAGSTASIGNFIDGMDIRNLRQRVDTKGIINAVRVIGSVVAGSLIERTVTDATSIAKYGRREPPSPFVNKNIEHNDAADDYGAQIIANFKDPKKYIDFQVMNSLMSAEDPDTSPRTAGTFGLGDVVTVTSSAANLSDQALRITGYSRKFFPDKTHTLSWKCISSGLRYGDSPFDTRGQNRDGAGLAGTVDGDTGDQTANAASTGNTNAAASTGNTNVAAGGTSVVAATSFGSQTVTMDENNWVPDTSVGLGAVNTTLTFVLVSMQGTGDFTKSVNRNFFFRVYDGTSYWPNSTGFIADTASGQATWLVVIPANMYNKTLTLQFKAYALITSTESYTFSIESIGTHTHTVTDPTHATTQNDPTHATTLNDPGHSTDITGGYATGSAD